MKNNKNGITVTSIVIYVVLFFMFTTATMTISSRINKNLFDDRGLSINITAINKLEYNLLKSSDESSSASISNNENIVAIEFSNSDRYVFDLNNHTVYKNGGKLLEFMTNFKVETQNENKSIKLNIELNKYTNKIERTIIINNLFYT